ncbi:MAG TPA: hypothetical protein VED40_01960 [Azospirillaceae bacterium]|nr:hypothetical protein [Azospirillaceae bacterium]
MRRSLPVLLSALLALPAAAAPVPEPVPDQPGGWRTACQQGPRGSFCTLMLEQTYAENRGGRGTVTLSLRRDTDCTSLHVAFERDIDVGRPVALQLDGGAPEPFYTGEELNLLARIVDAETADAGHLAATPEVAAFIDDARLGKLGDADAAASEMVARFARVKSPDRLGVACPVTARLLPRLREARTLRLSFSVAAPGQPEPYHWPALNRRVVEVPLDRLAEALDALPSGR